MAQKRYSNVIEMVFDICNNHVDERGQTIHRVERKLRRMKRKSAAQHRTISNYATFIAKVANTCDALANKVTDIESDGDADIANMLADLALLCRKQYMKPLEKK